MRRRLIGWSVAGAAALAYAVWPPANESSPSAPRSAASNEPDESVAATPSNVRLGPFPERANIGRPRADLFGPRSWAPPAPPPVAQQAAPPSAPPLPYKFAGKLVHDGSEQLFLSKGSVVLPVREGDTLDGTYKVESIATSRITLLYLPLGTRETIPVNSTLAARAPAAAKTPMSGATPAQSVAQARPTAKDSPATGSGSAQLRWEGPEAVPAGSSFSVALRMTSPQPVRASPLQLRFDASVLEPVAVRPGKFFGSRSDAFSYRISPDGAIYVGASGQGGAASDAELLVLTFKPIRSGATAEVKVSALSLQGTAGRPIAHEQLAAFRTAIGH